MSEHNSNDLPAAILMLTDDCLIRIMDILSMTDCISFGLTCFRIFTVYQQNRRTVFKCVDIDELKHLPLRNWMHFFKFCGHYMKEINIEFFPSCSNQLYELLGTYCINLKSINIIHREVTASDMAKLFPKLNELQNLELTVCDLKDDCMLELKPLPQLKKLDLSFNSDLTGLNMKQLPASIESLELRNCKGLQMKLLPEICKALPHLKKLHISYFTKDTLFQDLVTDNCCNSLENLTVRIESEEQHYEAIAMLPRLKKLTVMVCRIILVQLRPQLLTMLVKHKSKQLEYLFIGAFIHVNTPGMLEISKLSALRTLIFDGNREFGDPDIEMLCKLKQLENIHIFDCETVSNDALLRLVLACPKLQLLKLESCPQITDKLLSDLICELRLQIGRSLPIKLSLSSSKITLTMLQNMDVASKKIIIVDLYE